MEHSIADCSVSVTRAFREDGTTYPAYWELRDSGRGEILAAGVRNDDGKFVEPLSGEAWNRANVQISLRHMGVAHADAARMALWLVEHGVV